MTIYAAGAYYVSGFVKNGDDIGNYVSAFLTATEKPQAYKDCKCVINFGKNAPGLRARVIGECRLPDDGEDFRCEMYVDPTYVDRLCTASEHMDFFVFSGTVEVAPDGAQCGVTPDNWFYTDTAGIYQINVDTLFNGSRIRYGGEITVEGR